jgi:hypothetical protein
MACRTGAYCLARHAIANTRQVNPAAANGDVLAPPPSLGRRTYKDCWSTGRTYKDCRPTDNSSRCSLPRPPCARSCNPSPPWANGHTKIVGWRPCVRRLTAGNSSRCSLPPPLGNALQSLPFLGRRAYKDCRSRTRARLLAPKGINPSVVEITFACIVKQ